MNKQAKNLLIPNPKKFANQVVAFKNGGANKIHILADFDNTLTRAYVNNKRVISLISVLRDNNFLTPDYPAKAHALFNKFYPIENNRHISHKEKSRAMHSWWTLHFKLLIKSGFSKRDIACAVSLAKTSLRAGGNKFFKILKANKIPLVIMSANALGKESIKAYLKNGANHSGNIHIISNSFVWDKSSRAVDYDRPIIHSMNKAETVVKNFPSVMKKIKTRTNVILLGDKPEDTHMVAGFDYDHLIKIGFLNENVKTNLPFFKKHFDVVLLNDAPMDFINQLLKKII